MKCTLVKKSSLKAKAAPHRVGAAPVADFVFVDNGDDTCTVNGLDSVGNPVDISTVATLTVTSDTVGTITVDPPTGMTFAMHAVGPLSTPGTPVQITAVATWNDGSLGPFTFTLPVDVIAGAAGAIVIVPGTPTVH
jgi:hypothetical protein